MNTQRKPFSVFLCQYKCVYMYSSGQVLKHICREVSPIIQKEWKMFSRSSVENMEWHFFVHVAWFQAPRLFHLAFVVYIGKTLVTPPFIFISLPHVLLSLSFASPVGFLLNFTFWWLNGNRAIVFSTRIFTYAYIIFLSWKSWLSISIMLLVLSLV